jgi:hypothetical protein
MIKIPYVFAASMLALIPLFSKGQDIQLAPKVFSLRNSKLSLGIGIEGAFSSTMTSTSKPTGLDIQYKDARTTDGSNYPYLALGATIDLYSDNSLIGLLAGVNYSISTTTYKKENVATDYFSIDRIEVPVYLKFRPGAVGSKNHLWLLLGAIYSVPVTVKRDYVSSTSTSNDISYTDNDVSQASNILLASASLGYEGYTSKSTRLVVFATGSYSITPQFNTNYIEYRQANLSSNGSNGTTGGHSVFANFPGFAAHEVRLIFGIKYLFKLGKSKL